MKVEWTTLAYSRWNIDWKHRLLGVKTLQCLTVTMTSFLISAVQRNVQLSNSMIIRPSMLGLMASKVSCRGKIQLSHWSLVDTLMHRSDELTLPRAYTVNRPRTTSKYRANCALTATTRKQDRSTKMKNWQLISSLRNLCLCHTDSSQMLLSSPRARKP